MDAREAAIKEQIKALRTELAEIRVARGALAAGPVDSSTSRGNANLTIKEMVKAILGGAPAGMTAHDILAAIKVDYDKEIERTSLSPQLSRLKADDEVRLIGDRWFTHPNWMRVTSRQQDISSPDIGIDNGKGDDDDDDVPF